MKRVLKIIIAVLLVVLAVGAVFVLIKTTIATSNIYLFCNDVAVDNNSTMLLNEGVTRFDVMYLQSDSFEANNTEFKVQIVPNAIEKGNIVITDGENQKSFNDLKDLTSGFDISVDDNGFTINYDNSSIIEILEEVVNGNVSFVKYEDNQCHCDENAFVKLVVSSADNSEPFILKLRLHNENSTFSVLPDCEYELNGYTNRVKCEVCQNIIDLGEVVPYSHTFVNGEYVAPTCTEEGRTNIRECSVCGYVSSYDIIPPIGHTFGSGIVLVAPTENEVGILEESCYYCGIKRFTDIPVLPSGEHIHDLIDKEDIPATCQKEGKTNIKFCTLCEQIISYDIIPLAEHKSVTVAATVTCGADGLSEYTKCAVCGVHLTEPVEVSKDTIPHTPKVVASTATCTTGGLSEYKECSKCGFHITEPEEIGPLSGSGPGHNYRVVNTMSFCNDCGYTHVNGNGNITSASIPVYVFAGGYGSDSNYENDVISHNLEAYLKDFEPTCENATSTHSICTDYYFPYRYTICADCGYVKPIGVFDYNNHPVFDGYPRRNFENIHGWNFNFGVQTFELGDGAVMQSATCTTVGVYYQSTCKICHTGYVCKGEFTRAHNLGSAEYFEGESYRRCLDCGEIVLDIDTPRGVYDVTYSSNGLIVVKQELLGYNNPIIMIQSNYTWRQIIENHINVRLYYREVSAYGCPTKSYMCFDCIFNQFCFESDFVIRAGVCSNKYSDLEMGTAEDWYGFILYDYVDGEMVEITDLDSQANGIFVLQSMLR